MVPSEAPLPAPPRPAPPPRPPDLSAYATAFEHAPIGIALVGLDGGWIHVNRALCELFGYRNAELRAFDFQKITHPDDLDADLALVRETVAGTRSGYEMEKRYVHRDGHIIWTQLSVTLLREADGQPVHFISHIQDISDRKTFESRLLASENNFRRLADEASVMLWTADATQSSGHFNQAYLDFTGFTLADTKNGGWKDALHPDDLPGYLRVLDQAYADRQPFRHRHRLRHADASYRNVEDVGSPTHASDGSFEGFVGVYTDLTATVVAQERADELAERLGLATEAAKVGVWDWDITNGLAFWDSLMGDIFGIDLPADGLVTFEVWRDSLHPDDVAEAVATFESAVRGEMEFNTRFRINHPKSGVRHIRANGHVVHDGSGKPTRVVGVNWDVTEQFERENDIRAAMEAAERANLAKSTFLATMSHEIRTPLNGIIGFTHLLLDSHLPDDLKPLAHPILAGGESLLTIINDILDYSKIEAGHVDLERLEFSVDTLLREIVELLAPKASEKDLTIELQISSSLPKDVIGDPHRLRQIVVNLLSNAIKFTGGGTVTVDARARPLQGGRSSVTITVADTGIGIPDDKLTALFEPFNQLDASTNRRFGGTGLGLAISKRLVEAMRGDITVKSEVDAGTSFQVSIPFTIASSATEAAARAKSISQRIIPIQPVSTGARRLRLLVAEDNEINQRLIRQILGRMGFNQLRVVDNGREAVDAALAEDFDGILMDCQMPVMDGYEATAELRARGCKIPIVALTAAALSGDKERALAVGMTDYVSKPIRPDLLAEAVERLAEASGK